MSALPRKPSNPDSIGSGARHEAMNRTTTEKPQADLSLFDPDATSCALPTDHFNVIGDGREVSQALSRGVRWPIWLPLISILLVSIVIRVYDIDRGLSRLNYDPVRKVWPFERADPWLSFYRYGIYPPLLVGVAGAFTLLCGRWIWRESNTHQVRAMRQGGLFLLLLLVIGPGLLVNTGLKMMWGRPRPLQCQDFGGDLAFHSVGNWSSYYLPNSSFPSGHASIAFFLIGPAFIVDPKQARLRRTWMIGGIGYGLAMGFTRVLQGGHFLSDVLWAGIIVYFVGVGLAWLMLRFDQSTPELS